MINLLFSLVIFSFSTYADDMDDLFSSLDEEISKTQEDLGDKSLLAQAKRNSKLELEQRSIAHLVRPTNRAGLDRRDFFFDGKATGQTQVSEGSWQFGAQSFLEYGNQVDTYRGISRGFKERDSRKHIWTINKLYTVKSFDSGDLTIGKTTFKTGVGTLYSPANRFSIADLNDPLRPVELGNWLTQWDQSFFNKYNFTFLLIPIFNPSLSPSATSRWSGTGQNYDIQVDTTGLSTSSTISEEFPAVKLKNMQSMAQLKTVFWGSDFFVNIASGFSPGPILSSHGTDYKKEYVHAGSVATGFSTTSGRFEIHSEGTYQYAYGKKDDHFLSYVGGFTYNMDTWTKVIGLNKIESTVEYAGEKITLKQKGDQLVRSSQDSRRAQNNLIFRNIFEVNDDFRIVLGGNLDWDQGAWLFGGGAEYRMGKFSILGSVEALDGDTDSYYGQWRENDRVTLTFKFSH